MEDDIDRYLNDYAESDILRPSESSIRRNIIKSYKRGRSRTAGSILDAKIAADLTRGDWIAITLLQDINYNRIKDCTTNTSNAIKYSLNRGVLEGWGTTRMAYEIRRNITGNQGMGIVRAKMIARTEVINAYNRASMLVYEQAGIPDSEIEWISAMEERTCDVCMGYDGKPISVIGEIPPIHPNCRCTIFPKIK